MEWLYRQLTALKWCDRCKVVPTDGNTKFCPSCDLEVSKNAAIETLLVQTLQDKKKEQPHENG